MNALTYEKCIEALVDKLTEETRMRSYYEKKYLELLKQKEEAQNGDKN